MIRLLLLAWVLSWSGAALLLGQLPWFSRPRLVERLEPYVAGGAIHGHWHPGSAGSLREVIGPLSREAGERLARVFGVAEDVAVRLDRIQSPFDVTTFRMRQLGWMTVATALGATVAAALPLGPALSLMILVGAPLLAFLLIEQQLAAASSRWQRRLHLELPVVAEQLAMLLSAGFSLGAALQRLADRSPTSACGTELRRVCSRVRQGLSEVEAVREWAARARVGALDRLVPVIALNRDGGDLGRLLSDEARAIRRDLHRQLLETMQRREQQVWIPVTVATLVPGVLLLSIPFVEALRLFSGS